MFVNNKKYAKTLTKLVFIGKNKRLYMFKLVHKSIKKYIVLYKNVAEMLQKINLGHLGIN